jgi:hypothetical protein
VDCRVAGHPAGEHRVYTTSSKQALPTTEALTTAFDTTSTCHQTIAPTTSNSQQLTEQDSELWYTSGAIGPITSGFGKVAGLALVPKERSEVAGAAKAGTQPHSFQTCPVSYTSLIRDMVMSVAMCTEYGVQCTGVGTKVEAVWQYGVHCCLMYSTESMNSPDQIIDTAIVCCGLHYLSL